MPDRGLLESRDRTSGGVMGGFASPVARQAAVSGIAFRRCDLKQRERATPRQTDRVSKTGRPSCPIVSEVFMIRGYSDHAANERTFLAWVRTGIAVIEFGFVIEKFNLFVLTMANASSRDVDCNSKGFPDRLAVTTGSPLSLLELPLWWSQ